MRSLAIFGAVVIAITAFAEPPDFEAASTWLWEQSFSKSCEAFDAFLKANPTSSLAREALAKRAYTCWRVGRGNGASELRKMADEGEQDYARAFAQWALYRQGHRPFEQVMPLLQIASQADARIGTEARRMLVEGCLEQLQNAYDEPRVTRFANCALENARSANQKFQARFLRAQAWLRVEASRSKGEKELKEVGASDSDWADDALWVLAQDRESKERYLDALAHYDEIVRRFSPTTSNRLSDARRAAETIRRPLLSMSVYQNALPGVKVPVQLNFRNLTTVTWTLKRVDPFTATAGSPVNTASFAGQTERTWNETLEAKAPHAPGNRTFELDVPGPGLYVLSVTGGTLTASDFAAVSNIAAVTKSDRTQVQVFVSDAETGKAQADAEVALIKGDFVNKQVARTNTQGLATFRLDSTNATFHVWAKVGQNTAYSRAGDVYVSNWSRQDLAYVMFDRPLYKPGETVGLKLFLRSREAGPSEPLVGRTVTVTIRDPNGKEVSTSTLTTSGFGTASSSLTLPQSATLGQYSASVHERGGSYQHPLLSFRVEEFKPPEATVSVSPVGAPKPGQPVKLKVTAKYYSGGPLTQAEGRALVTVSSWSHSFPPWPEDTADAERERHWGRRRDAPLANHTLTFKTGADGTAEVEVPTVADRGDLEISATVFVTDASRREIQGSGTAHVSSTASFVDVRSDHFIYRPGERVTLKLRSEDANGRPTSHDVVVRLSRLSSPTSSQTSKIAEVRTKTVDGRGVAQLEADALGPVRVDVLDAAQEDRGPLATTDLWLTSETKPIPPPGASFQLLLDRAPLAVGQSLRALVVTATAGGHVWLTLEHEAIVVSKVVEMNGRAKYVEIPLPVEAAPNAWFMIHRFENGDPQHHQTALQVKGSSVDLDVSVAFERSVAEPGSTLPVSIRAQKGPAGPTETALTIVDEALFAIEPERRDFLPFFARQQRRLAVQTRRSTDWKAVRKRPTPSQPAPDEPRRQIAEDKRPAPKSVEAVAGGGLVGRSMAAPAAAAFDALAAPAEEKAKKSVARDEAEADSSPGSSPVRTRTDFGNSAGWFSELPGAMGSATTQSIKVTDSLTSWKAVATVVTKSAHLGQGSATLRTAMPLMVRLQSPRFFIEGDEVVLSAVIESHLPKAGPVQVSISAPGLKELTGASKTVNVTPDQVTRFDVRFKVTALGDRQLRAQVRSGSFADAMELSIPSFVHGSAQRQFFAGRLTDSFTFEVNLPEKRKPTLTKLELALSPSLLSVMLDGLPYLAQYPYGCVEQTLSRFVPAVIARKAIQDGHLPDSRIPRDLDDMVQKGLERLRGFQHSDGGWGWWQTDSTNLWMTAYVVYALGLAKDAGVAIDTSMVNRGRSYLLGHLGEALDNADTHAFAVYALAQSGSVPKNVLDQTFERRTKMAPRGRALVALAMLALKDPRARIAVENLDDVVKTAQSRADAAVGEVNDAWSTSAAIEATAATLTAMSRWPEGSKYVGPLTDFLVLRRNGGKWRSTRDTALAIYALADIARNENAAAQQGSFAVSINGMVAKQVKYSRGGLELGALVFSDQDFKSGKNVVTVKRDGAGTGYWAATWDVFNQNDFIKGVGGDVKVARTYTLLGKPSTEKAQAPTEYGMPVESGVRLRVDVEITANKAVEFVMIEDLKPAGFEAVQQRSGPEVCNYACAHAELRTDRVAMFVTSLRVGTTKLSYELRAETPGKFSALPARAEAMYAPEIQATADEMRFEVRDAPTGGVATP